MSLLSTFLSKLFGGAKAKVNAAITDDLNKIKPVAKALVDQTVSQISARIGQGEQFVNRPDALRAAITTAISAEASRRGWSSLVVQALDMAIYAASPQLIVSADDTVQTAQKKVYLVANAVKDYIDQAQPRL